MYVCTRTFTQVVFVVPRCRYMITIEDRGFRDTTRGETRQRGKRSTRQKKWTSVFDPQRSCTRRQQVAGVHLYRRSRPRKGFPQPYRDYAHSYYTSSCCCSYGSCEQQGQRTKENERAQGICHHHISTSPFPYRDIQLRPHTYHTRAVSTRAVHTKVKRCREATTQGRVVRWSAPFGRAYTVLVGCA